MESTLVNSDTDKWKLLLHGHTEELEGGMDIPQNITGSVLIGSWVKTVLLQLEDFLLGVRKPWLLS